MGQGGIKRRKLATMMFKTTIKTFKMTLEGRKKTFKMTAKGPKTTTTTLKITIKRCKMAMKTLKITSCRDSRLSDNALLSCL